MSSTSSNGWPVLFTSTFLHDWDLPNCGRTFRIRNGSAGFLLAHIALWFHEEIDKLDVGGQDDWGHNVRKIAGTSTYSNHASGTAVDLNATKYPYHVPVERVFTKEQIEKIRKRLHVYKGCIRWGGDFSPQWVDGMHFEIVASMDQCERVAKRLIDSPRGDRIIELNQKQKAVIYS